ncbi:hypothetical protein [Atopobium sp. oral taxon 416]|uniref:hypothetical protein n=1 Tax=Atopobium sp. oral taxon 416 TaxID=712157 RepID=UPI001BA619B1|nr:hypothetical protein [Atopobium sp. oral taxon 416]QUC02261.1 hypothetical protein J4859_09385 [Atopobium sp. oral taxon 416]
MLPAPVRIELLVGAGSRIVLLVDLDVAGQHDAVLDPVQDLEQLRYPVGQCGLWPALLPYQAVHALDREGLEQKFAPLGHRSLCPWNMVPSMGVNVLPQKGQLSRT